MNRAQFLVVGMLLAGVALSGCTSVIGGRAVPAAGPSDANAVAVAIEPAGGCARSADPATCVEWTRTSVDTGDKLVATATDNAPAAGQMVCSALSDTQWESFLGKDFYRYLDDDACTVSSQDNQLMVRAMVVTGTTWSDYVAVATRNSADTSTRFTIGDRDVLRSAPPPTVDGIGQDVEDLTIGASDKPEPWVLRVQVVVRQPRGKASTTPVDRARLGFRDALVGDLLTALFP